MLGYLKSLSLLLSFGLLVSACSQTSLAYRNLDWVIPWRVNQYLDLDSQQKAWFKPRLQAHLDWHCSAELPRYVDWLQHTQDLLQEPAPDAGQLEAQMVEAEQAFHSIVQQTNPTAVSLLGALRPEQVERLYARMEKDNLEDRQEFLEPPLETQISERAERLEKRLRPWFGQLNDAQRARIAEWASERRDQNRQWLENRTRWQSEFRAVLDARGDADFPERMTQVLENRRGAHDERATQAYQESRQALAALFSDLLAAADDKQRAQAGKRFASIQTDLAGQICTG
ncbi:hypothetical protein DNK06_22945 [Pseudomonas daroniae]|uniref:Lipoprotein n=1 Tax=Phytopseudomonas daroniae TaxID=2487519 RepID=A0A4Q9QH59_9GAMM|nr:MULTISPECIES: DUF6279 family lipoprotein [Pseudomonas]TBU72063.1 hypothetical protein DNK06_22945 [Pseudomonas daroniae]TBU78128.1 hypothetical protein DNK31_20280 [Pseudomonas sp. FRB 228]TBU87944.1 hypothetical protein DNJ99_20505 [Pseudomonas daroniae]